MNYFFTEILINDTQLKTVSLYVLNTKQQILFKLSFKLPICILCSLKKHSKTKLIESYLITCLVAIDYYLLSFNLTITKSSF